MKDFNYLKKAIWRYFASISCYDFIQIIKFEIISCLFRGLSLGLILQKKQAVTAFILPLSLSLSADKVHTTSFLNFPPPSRHFLVGLNKPFAKIRNLFRTPLDLHNWIDSEIKYSNLMLMQLPYHKVASSYTSCLKAQAGFLNFLWRGFLILMYCDLLTKFWFPSQ